VFEYLLKKLHTNHKHTPIYICCIIIIIIISSSSSSSSISSIIIIQFPWQGTPTLPVLVTATDVDKFNASESTIYGTVRSIKCKSLSTKSKHGVGNAVAGWPMQLLARTKGPSSNNKPSV